jgi:hypothetical protein
LHVEISPSRPARDARTQISSSFRATSHVAGVRFTILKNFFGRWRSERLRQAVSDQKPGESLGVIRAICTRTAPFGRSRKRRETF